MSKYLIMAILIMVNGSHVQAVDGGGGHFRWQDYLPSKEKLICYLDWALIYAARSYQQAVLANLAMAGDPEAIKAWQDLMATYNPSELLCMVGGQSIDQLASTLTRILPAISGLSWATRQALEAAIYQALEKVQGR